MNFKFGPAITAAVMATTSPSLVPSGSFGQHIRENYETSIQIESVLLLSGTPLPTFSGGQARGGTTQPANQFGHILKARVGSETDLPRQIGPAAALAALPFLRDPAIQEWKDQYFDGINDDFVVAAIIFDDADENEFRWSFFRVIFECEYDANARSVLPFLSRLLEEGSGASRAAAAAALGDSGLPEVTEWLRQRLLREGNAIVRSVISTYLSADLANVVVPA